MIFLVYPAPLGCVGSQSVTLLMYQVPQELRRAIAASLYNFERFEGSGRTRPYLIKAALLLTVWTLSYIYNLSEVLEKDVARPRSDERRSAITSATTRAIANEGLGAATAAIAKEAGISNGSLFTYFDTKSDLFNQLYRELKTEMAAAALDGLPSEGAIREKMSHVWSHWLNWAISYPEKRRALALLSVSGEITAESHEIASRTMARISQLLEQSRQNGPMSDAPLGFVAALMNALADTTIDFINRDPANADKHSVAAFEALWRMVD